MSIRITSGFSERASKIASSRGARLADGLQVRLLVDQHREPGSDDRVVVDDENANRHLTGTSATSVVPSPFAGLDRDRAAEQRQPLAHADQAEAVVGVRSGSNPLPSSSITTATASPLARQQDADRMRLGVLHHVRQRLLHDPVERRLDLLGQAPLSERVPGNRPRARSARRTSRPAARAPATRPKSSSAFGRRSTRKLPDILQRRDDGSPQLGDSGAQLVAFDQVLECLQTEQDRRQRLPCLVVQLTREPAALGLLRLDDPPERIAGDALREIDGNRCT